MTESYRFRHPRQSTMSGDSVVATESTQGSVATTLLMTTTTLERRSRGVTDSARAATRAHGESWAERGKIVDKSTRKHQKA